MTYSKAGFLLGLINIALSAAIITILLSIFGYVQAGWYAEVEGNVTRKNESSSDWVLTDIEGNHHHTIGQLRATVGYSYKNVDVFGGVNHISMPNYNNDSGFNGLTVGVKYRREF